MFISKQEKKKGGRLVVEIWRFLTKTYPSLCMWDYGQLFLKVLKYIFTNLWTVYYLNHNRFTLFVKAVLNILSDHKCWALKIFQKYGLNMMFKLTWTVTFVLLLCGTCFQEGFMHIKNNSFSWFSYYPQSLLDIKAFPASYFWFMNKF